MKKFKTFIAVIAIGLLTVLPAAANTNPTNPTSKEAKIILRSEIVDLLGNHAYDLEDQVLEAQVSVILNNQNELVVVAITSKNETISNYVKSRLNYKKVSVKGIQKGTVYRVPLKMVQSS